MDLHFAAGCTSSEEPFLYIAISHSYNGHMQVSVADAKNKLPELIKAVEDGKPVTICRRGVPVVDIVRTAKPKGQKPKFGTMRGEIQIVDPDWWKPMTDEAIEDLFGSE
jgi:prevent-host-death family protein